MPVSAALLLDTLQSLLESEQASLFRFMREGSPYLTRATLDTRRQIEQMATASDRHAAALAELITSLGGFLPPEAVHPANQYLSFLTLKFLLPKLAEAKRNSIERYQNALRALPDAPPHVLQRLKAHLSDHRADLTALEQSIKITH